MGLEPTDKADQALSNGASEQMGSLPRSELKQRASAGIFIVGSRGLAILLIGFAGNVVVARLLTPHDFGVVALGISLMQFAGMLSDGGIGAGLIRRPEPPKIEELQALTALQLTVTVAFACVVTAVATPFFGWVGWVIALMASSMPLVALQFPGRILLERSLSYRPLAMVEVSQVVTYHACAIALVVAGFGVWGLAAATVVRAAMAALVMARVSPVGLVLPRLSWRWIRPLVGFGIPFQATTATWLIRDQGLNMGIALIASVSTLGLWSLARRLMEIPTLLLESLWRVSYPAMSQLSMRNEDAAPVIERAIGMTGICTGVILAGLAGSAPGLIPGLFGEQWRAASGVIPGASLGLLVGGSVSVSTVGYLYAAGDAAAVLRASIVRTAVAFAVTLPLLLVLGVSAVGVGLLVSSVAESVVLGRATLKRIRVRLVEPLVTPLMVGVISGGVGWLITEIGGADLLSGLIGGTASVLGFLAGLMLVQREPLLDTLRFALGSMRAALRTV
jgi:polysaccharide transporter, PST family